jgi:fatty-acyl-CoA synthase
MKAERLIFDAWLEHAAADPERDAIVHWVAGEEPRRWSRAALLERAGWFARALADRGVRPGDVCALIVRHHAELYPLYLGVSCLGAVPAVLAYPNPRVHPDKFRHGLEGMARKSGLDWILTERALEAVVGPLVAGASGVRGVLTPLEGELGRATPGRPDARPDEPCLLQHSSGTTGLQKAVMLSHRSVLEHVRRYGEAIALGPSDKVVSWLPLYHDMGLIAALHLPLAAGVPTVQLDPFEWVQAPAILLEAIARERGTISWLPNFAYNLLADRVNEEDLAGLSLASVRLLVNCSEPVRDESHERLLGRLRGHGLREEALSACYAMAETTFAVTQTRPGARARALPLDRDALAQGRAVSAGDPARTRRCVSSGVPIEGCAVRVLGPSGEELEDDRTGELAIASESIFSGYRNDPEQTARVLRDGFYASGDLGFRHEGEIYVVGRKKEIIIQAGKNLYPGDIEDAVSQVAGVVPGRVVAFGREDDATGTEEVCVVAETDGGVERRALRVAVLEAAAQIGVAVGRLYVAPSRWLVKSTSGKLGRKQNAERALRELEWS